jgi:hypothetical protein
MFWLRAIWVWILIIFAEIIHGTLRQLFLAPLVGDFPARRIAFFTGLIIIFAITWFCIKWIEVPDTKSLLGIGAMWVGLTLLFEFGLGFWVLDYSRERMFEDYDIGRGGLMGIGLLFLLFFPLLADKLQKNKAP